MENHLRAALDAGEFVYTAELVMGRDHRVPEAEEFVRDASQEPEGIKIISATDLPGGSPALPPEAFVSEVLEHGLTPIIHLTGKDGNRGFLEGRLHTAARMGAENILALTGDVPKPGFGGVSKPVFDFDSVLILHLVNALREGIEYTIGRRTVTTTPFDFFPGVVVNPYKVHEPDQMMQLYKLELKIASGARFIITQLGFDLRKLYEVRQYMLREGLSHVPLIANVYVPTATIARMMQEGEVAGCTISDELIKKLQGEKKPQRLEWAALTLAAVRDLGFAGAHIGGFGLTHSDFMKMIDRSNEIGGDWRQRIDELIFPYPGQFYLLPEGSDGLSNGNGEYNAPAIRPRPSLSLRFSNIFHRLVTAEGSLGTRLLGPRIRGADGLPRHNLWYRLMVFSDLYRKATYGCVMCGDCAIDHLHYAACPMRQCYKELRNGPCGGSRVDGTCEGDPDQTCVWHLAYLNALAGKEDPKSFSRVLFPPRDWSLDHTSPLANRMVGIDNYSRRKEVTVPQQKQE